MLNDGFMKEFGESDGLGSSDNKIRVSNGRVTVQLETAVSTITQEYLLEFTSEYGISEDLHPELPDRGDRIVDFPEGKIGMYTKFFEFANFRIPISQFLFDILGHYQIHLSQLDGFVQPDQRSKSCRDQNRHPSSCCSRGATANGHRKPADRYGGAEQINEGDGAEDQGPETMASIVPPAGPLLTTGAAPNIVEEKGTVADAPLVSKRRRKKANEESNVNAPWKVLRKDFDVSHPTQSTVGGGGESLASKRVGASSTVSAPASQETPAGIMNPDLISFAKPSSSKGATVAGGPESDPSSPTIVMSPRCIYQPEWGVTNGCRLDTLSSCQELVDHLAPPGYFSELRHLTNEEFLGQFNMTLARQVAIGSQLRLRFEQEAKLLRKSVAQVARRDQRIQAMKGKKKNLETLLEAEADMRKAAEAKNAELVKEMESLRAQFTELQVSRDGLSHQVSTLQAQVTGEEKIKATFEEFKKYEDERVSARCAKMDSRLDALSIDFDEELYPHMLTATAGRRWVIGHGLCLAVLKCAESLELRQTFANVVSAGITKGFCDGLKYGVEQGEAKLDLAMVEGYDPEAEGKFIATMQALKDLKYPLIDELEKLRDAPMDVLMASLYLESDTGADAPQWIRDLRPSSSQLKIPVYPEVRDPQDPWAVKEEMLLEDAIATNVNRTKKKKKCRIVCRTHGVGSAHHARSDGVPVSVPTAVPQGLAILLADAATQTDVSEEESSPKLTRSKSLPSM
ncbi:hypothetical protein Tco_0690136 [Tanacetum coccineum]